MSLKLRYMQSADVPAVVEVDRLSFSPSWSAGSFQFEISQSLCSFMVVLEHRVQRPAVGLRRWWEALRGHDNPQVDQVQILGFGGLWKIEDEAHISTLASHPEQRGKKYGEIVLAGMLNRAVNLGASYVVLEVRVSNTVAQNLYHKYGFTIEQTRKNYYQNNREDAYDMRLRLDAPGTVERLQQHYAALTRQIAFVDAYSTTPHARLGV